MSFLAPAAFFLGLTLPIIIVFYLLKLRRIDQRVSSTYLWRKMVRDLEANAPWQRLRWNLLMVLQLLVLILLTLALARPFTWQAGSASQETIFIIDASASMQATDVSPSRLKAAKDTVLSQIANLPDGARMTVISAGKKAEVLLSSSQDRQLAQAAVESIQPGTTDSDMTVALQLASAIAARQSDTEVVVVSDGRVELPERLVLNGTLRYIAIGTEAGNQAVSMLSLEKDATGSMVEAFVQVANYASEAVKRRLSVYANGVLVNAIDVSLEAKEQKAIPLENLPLDTLVVEVRLDRSSSADAASNAPSDALALDDGAFAVLEESAQGKVLLVSAGNLFVRTALQLLPGVELTEALPSDTLQYDDSYDLIIFDGVALPTPLPPNNLLLIAPASGGGEFSVSGTVDSPLLRPVALDDPLLEYTQLSDASVLDANNITLPDWATLVLTGDANGKSYPMLFYGKPEGRRVAVIAFNLLHSDLPLNISFPILWNNLVNWLISENNPGGGMQTQLTPGESLSVPMPVGVTKAVITRPDGSSVTLEAEEDGASSIVFADTTQLGLYTVQMGEDSRAYFAVNLFIPTESSLTPAETLPGIESTNTGAEAQDQAHREWWRLLALAALGVLLAEWLLFNRAGLVRLRDRIRDRIQNFLPQKEGKGFGRR